VGALVRFGQAITDWASNLSTAAENVGVLTSEMIAFNRVGVQTGNAGDQVARVMGRIKTELDGAIRGSEQSREKFERLGLSMRDLAAMDTADQFMAVMRAAKETGQPLEAMADLVGERLGPRFVKFINQVTGPDGLPALHAAYGQAFDATEKFQSKWKLGWDKTRSWFLINWRQMIEEFRQTDEAMRYGIDEAARRATQRASGPENADRQAQIEQGIDAAQKAIDKGEQKKADAIREGNRLAAEARLEGEEKMEADFVRKQQDLLDQIAKAENDKDYILRAALSDRLMQMDKFYREDIAKLRAAEKEKAEVLRAAETEKQAREQERVQREQTARERPILSEIERLRERGMDSSDRLRGRGVDSDTMATVGGFFGNERAGMAIADKQLQVAREQKAILTEIKERIGDLRAARGGGI
jgi:hypothetical protein